MKINPKKIMEYRNIVITKTNNIDMFVSSLICQHFFPKTPGIPVGFISTVLYQNPLSFSSRINILNNILKNKNQKDTKLIKKLNDIANIRNIFAHSDLVIKNKDNEEYVFNPKDFSKPIDFEKEYTNFYKLTMVVDPVLFKLYTDMGGKLEKKPSFVFLDENSTKVEGEKE